MAEETTEQLQARLDQAEADKKVLEEKLEAANKNLAEGSKVIDDMQKAIDEKAAVAKSGSDFPTVTVEKKKYEIRVTNKVRYKGKEYTADAIKKNKEIAEALVKIKASFMVSIDK